MPDIEGRYLRIRYIDSRNQATEIARISAVAILYAVTILTFVFGIVAFDQLTHIVGFTILVSSGVYGLLSSIGVDKSA